MKCSASESKPFRSRSIVEIPGRARREELLSLKNNKIFQPPNATAIVECCKWSHPWFELGKKKQPKANGSNIQVTLRERQWMKQFRESFSFFLPITFLESSSSVHWQRSIAAWLETPRRRNQARNQDFVLSVLDSSAE